MAWRLTVLLIAERRLCGTLVLAMRAVSTKNYPHFRPLHDRVLLRRLCPRAEGSLWNSGCGDGTAQPGQGGAVKVGHEELLAVREDDSIAALPA